MNNNDIERAIEYFKDPFKSECKMEEHENAVKLAIEALTKQQTEKRIEKLIAEREYWKREALKLAAENGERKITEAIHAC